MADRAVAINPVSVRPGLAVAALVLGLLVLPFAAVLARAEPGGGLSPFDWAAIRFTLAQAAASAVLSVLLSIPLARALSRTEFPGRRLLVVLLGAPFLLPVISAVMGLLVVFGRQGWVNAALEATGLPAISIYGFGGVVLAHVFFNMPLATRLLLQGWADVPAEQFRLAAQLRLPGWQRFIVLEWPMLKRVLPGALGLIFVICLTSFAVALILGGGPAATTIELAIYQAFRFDFDLGRAALLAMVQLVVAMSAALFLFRLLPDQTPGLSLGGFARRFDRAWWDAPVIFMGAAFLIAPLAALLGDGLTGLGDIPPQVWRSAAISLGVALASTALLLAMLLPLAALAARQGGAEAAGIIGLAMSPLVLGTGAFILLNPVFRADQIALPLTALVNALLTLPFALRILVPGVRAAIADYGRMGVSLKIRGWAFWRLIILPRVRAPLGFALGVGAAFSLGDLGVIALFADADTATLPLQIERLLGSYRTDAAAGASLLLVVMTFGSFWAFDAWGRRGT